MSFKRKNNKAKLMLSGSGTDVLSLWYYKEYAFLQYQMEKESGINAIIGQHRICSLHGKLLNTNVTSRQKENRNYEKI